MLLGGIQVAPFVEYTGQAKLRFVDNLKRRITPSVVAEDSQGAIVVGYGAKSRAGFSPDGLIGLEANLRFAGPETMETKIFARLSAWQNWIFQRPNAVGERGALTLYGKPERPTFDFRRT